MKIKHIVIFLAGLTIIIAGLALLNRPEKSRPDYLTIFSGEEMLREYSMDELSQLPYVEVNKTIISSSQDNISGLWRGVPLRELLIDAGVDLNAYSYVDCRGTDGYIASFTMQEVTADNNLIITYALDGIRLETEKDGVGYSRILVQSDPFGTRSTFYLYQIVIR